MSAEERLVSPANKKRIPPGKCRRSRGLLFGIITRCRRRLGGSKDLYRSPYESRGKNSFRLLKDSSGRTWWKRDPSLSTRTFPAVDIYLRTLCMPRRKRTKFCGLDAGGISFEIQLLGYAAQVETSFYRPLATALPAIAFHSIREIYSVSEA